MPSSTPDESASESDVRRTAVRAARGEVRRLFWKAVSFLAGAYLVAASMGTPQFVASMASPLSATVAAAVGVLFFVGGAYLLAYAFDFDRAVVRWVRAHRP